MIRFSILLSLVLWLWPGVIQSQDLIDQVQESFAGVESVTVKGIFCDVEVVPGSNSTVSLEGEIRATRRYEDLTIKYTQKGSLLEVWVEQPRNIIGQVKGFLNLTVPVSTLLKVQNVSGSVKVQGVGRELLNLESVSGSITAADIPCGANFKTVSGSIKATIVDGDLVAKTVSGSLNVSDVKGSAELSSVSGSVTGRSILKAVNASSVSGSVHLSEVFSDIKGKSVSGGIHLTDIKGNVTVNSTSGSVSLTNVVGELHASSISGSIKGSGIMLTGASTFKNTSGSINLDLDNDVATMSFDLRSGSGSLEAGGARGDKHLVVGTGPVKVNGNTASGSQKYY
jgi:DUF4097 and DUF4098 domain-containing protein YvlB